MKEKYIAPDYSLSSFTCPHCGAHSQMDLSIITIQDGYAWIYSKKFLSSVGLVLYLAISIPLYYYVVPLIRETNPSWYIVYLLLLFLIFVNIVKLFTKIREWAYPESVFNIGEQETSYKKIIKRRNYILGAISTIVLGVLSSIFATKYF